MPYLGNVPAENYAQVSYQDLTGGSGTSFTLDYPVGSAGEIEVFVNNVRQEPTVAYTVSGTSLTMTGSISATDDFYVVFQGKAQQTIGIPEKQTDGTYLFGDSVTIDADGSTVLTVDRATSDGTIIDVQKDGSSVGSIGTIVGYMTVGSDDTGVLFHNNEESIQPWNVGANTGIDATINLGASNARFKDLYLSGGVFLGGTGPANLLDDAEEGTWTPSIYSGPTGVTYNNQQGYYYKIGSIVFVRFYINFNCTGGVGTFVKCTGLPYVQNVTGISWLAAGGFGGTYNSATNARNAAIEATNNIFRAGNDYLLSSTGSSITIEGTFVYGTAS